jgi:DHA1 family arabinose polymer transporter-like MFS transporter
MAPKKALIILMLLFTLFNTLSAFAPNIVILCAARLLSGLPHGAFFGVGSVVATRLAAKGKQAQAISIMFGGLTVANLLMVPLGTYLGHQFSWRFTFGLVGFIGLVTLTAIFLLLPALPVQRAGNLRTELALFNRLEIWLIVLITAIGTGGLFCWISYIAPLLTEVGHFSASQVPYLLMVAGLGMVAGNVVGGKLADRLTPSYSCLVLLLAMAATLGIIHFTAWNPILTVLMTFIAGACSLAVASPIQIMMIHSAKGAEMLGASVTQASFNIGNALGAFLGGLPIAAGYGYTSPELVGVAMALVGAGFALLLIRINVRKQALQLSV